MGMYKSMLHINSNYFTIIINFMGWWLNLYYYIVDFLYDMHGNVHIYNSNNASAATFICIYYFFLL